MTDRPIIFSAPMVRALLEGTKTQTRRVLKPQPIVAASSIRQVATQKSSGAPVFNFYDRNGKPLCAIPCSSGMLGEFIPRYAIGDRLWVRENFQLLSYGDYLPTKYWPADVRYKATDSCADLNAEARGYPWRPSIHMPRWSSRLTLAVTDVRVQPLQEITLADICAEGLATSIYDFKPAQRGFDAWIDLWNSINGAGAWEANPWVVAVSFEVHQCNIDQMQEQEAA